MKKVALALLLGLSSAFAQDPIVAGSKVYIDPMNGFGSYLTAAFEKKQVPLIVVGDKAKADYEVSGTAESQKANWAKILLTKQTGSTEEASISLVDLKTGAVLFAYAVNKRSSARGKQSAAEACAKHLRNKIQEK